MHRRHHLPWGLKRAVLSALYGRVKCPNCGTGCDDAHDAITHCPPVAARKPGTEPAEVSP